MLLLLIFASWSSYGFSLLRSDKKIWFFPGPSLLGIWQRWMALTWPYVTCLSCAQMLCVALTNKGQLRSEVNGWSFSTW